MDKMELPVNTSAFSASYRGFRWEISPARFPAKNKVKHTETHRNTV